MDELIERLRRNDIVLTPKDVLTVCEQAAEKIEQLTLSLTEHKIDKDITVKTLKKKLEIAMERQRISTKTAHMMERQVDLYRKLPACYNGKTAAEWYHLYCQEVIKNSGIVDGR